VITLDRDTNTVRKSKCFLPTEFVTLHPFKRLLVASIPFAPEVFCRVFLFEPKCGGAAAQLRFLWDLAKGVGPAFYNVYRLQGIHSRAALAERSRIAHDLHDGVAQALHALAFRLYALRTATRLSDRQQREELLELQELVQKEAQQLRHMLQHLRPIEVGPKQLAEFLSAMVERYQDDTGIVAKFICQASALNLSPATCREIASIVQEALANVHRHSGAQNVKVNLSTQDDACILTVEDDGRGFEFSGRRSLVELEEIRRGPSIIKQRTRAIGADLTVDSRPGQGARLEIRFPVQANINDEVPNSHSYRR
jgi:signal transduction histidine kinase